MVVDAPRPLSAAAFEALFRDLAPAIRRFAERSLGADLADDIVNDTFAVVWRRWSDLPEDADLRRAWVYLVARHSIGHALRSRSRSARAAERVQREPAYGADTATDVAGSDRVARLLADLPPREREAMSLVVWDGLSASQAAFVLGCSTTAISSRLSRARRRLEQGLKADPETSREVGP